MISESKTLSPMSLCCVLLVLGAAFTLPAAADPVPRILLAGDSWSALMQAFDTYQTVFPEYPGCESYRSIGFRTAVVGMRATEFTAPTMLSKVAEELAQYPTIDIVHLSLGGNDILYGTWRPTMTPAQQQALFDNVTAHIETVIDFILAQRPDIRIVLCGYTFANHASSGITMQQANQAILELEQTKRVMVQGKDRVFYVHNLGLMQYTYGIPQADPPIPPMSVPYPGGYPDYDPMPGGNILYGAPLEALVDGDIHLTPAGYAVLARRCMDEIYTEWLDYPKVFQVQLQQITDADAVFEVRFSEPVAGVEVSDFSPSIHLKSLDVISVTGSGDTYLVTVALDGAPGTVHLDVLDDDSIVDLNGAPLGGPGVGNGVFMYHGVFTYQDPPPLEEDDFDAFLSFLDIATAPYADMLNGFSFSPDQCDANGGFFGLDPVQIAGNGLLDSCEFGLIQACLRDNALDLSAYGGVTHAMVSAAWQNNLLQMREDLGGSGSLALSVLRGLDSILAAYFILGDTISSLLPPMLIFAASNYNEFPLDLTVPDRVNYVMMPNHMGLHGDADGDGFTNKQEYDFFMPIGGRVLYIQAALNPGITPQSDCYNSEGGAFLEGDSFCLVVPGPVAYGADFQWKKDGQPLQDHGPVRGSRWRTLHITSLRISDRGQYTCEYDDGAKVQRVFGPVDVEVVRAMPASNAAGLLVLIALLVSVMAIKLRRRPVPPSA